MTKKLAIEMSLPHLRLMRLHQPVGIWLLFWPCAWALILASEGFPEPQLLLAFFAGALLMRSAGCIINDIADREFDKQVERTKNRPLACGELSVRQALVLLLALLVLSLLVAIYLGTAVLMWSALALAPVAIYPFMKRISWWPQLFLGLTFNWGALVGWVAVRGEVEWPALLLYAGCVLWTLGYDTIYAHQDKLDDARIGIKSTALRLGNHTRSFVTACYLLSFASWALLAAATVTQLWQWVWLLPVALHLGWQVTTLEIDSPQNCLRRFRSNSQLGLVLALALCMINATS